MSKTAIVYTCGHADPGVSNERYEWLGKLFYDVKPDYIVDLGDGADLRSLNTYDTTKPKAIVAQSYEADVEHYNDAMDKLWHLFRHNKKRRPFRIGFEGNHEHRIKRALSIDPRLEGQKYGISFGHLQTDHWFDVYHEYHNSAPSIADYDGVSYSHFFSSGNSGNAVSGIHHAYTLLQNRFCSTTCGHSHKRSIYFKDSSNPWPTIGAVVGCFKGAEESWAGQSNNDWWSGVVIKREIENGVYEPQWISLSTLRKAYG